MPNITSIGSNECALIRQFLNGVLKESPQALGLTATVGKILYAPHGGSCEVKVEFTTGDGDKVEFERYCALFDMKPEDYGKPFRANGINYTVAGLEMKRRKYPIKGKSAEGKIVLFTTSIIKQLRTP